MPNFNSTHERKEYDKHRIATIKQISQLLLSSDNARQQTARQTLQCLKLFAEWQFSFFHNGFNEQTDAASDDLGQSIFEFDPLYPTEYALNVTSEQVNHDFEVLMRIIAHRQIAGLTEGMQDRIQLADQLAYQALQVAFASATAALIEPTTVLTYFQKSTSIRVIPYAPVALIGLPLLGNVDNKALAIASRDLLALPHEVGHHIYWRRLAIDPKNTVRDNLRIGLQQSDLNLPAWIQNWEEEIFADVYSCLIAGPVSALTIQEILQGVPAHLALQDDHHYPVPLIRPLIHIAVLERLAELVQDAEQADQLKNAATVLQNRWHQWTVEKLTLPTWFIPIGETEPVTTLEAQRQLKAVVHFIMGNSLKSLLPGVRQNFKDALWSSGLSSDQISFPEAERTLKAQFANFAENFKAPLGNHLPELVEVEDGFVQLVQNETKIGHPTKRGRTGLELPFEVLRDEILAGGEPPEAEKGDRPWWFSVLQAAYWTTEGPGPKQIGT